MATATDKVGPVADKLDFAATDIFELVFKKGNVLQTLHFKCSSKETAIEKAKLYCEKRQLRYVYVNPWLHDIDKMIEFEAEEGWGKR